MAGTASSIGRARELLRELRLGIRRIEVVRSRTRDDDDDAWTKCAIEVSRTKAGVLVNRSSVYTETRSLVDQALPTVVVLLLLRPALFFVSYSAPSNTFSTRIV